MNPVGNKVVIPVILPDFRYDKVELLKSVELFTVQPNRLADVKSQFENTVPDRLLSCKSIDIKDSFVKVVSFPTTIIIISLTDSCKKLDVAAILEVTVVLPIPFIVTVPILDAVEIVAIDELSLVCVIVYESVFVVIILVPPGIEIVELRMYFV